jgi:hypothetical protein
MHPRFSYEDWWDHVVVRRRNKYKGIWLRASPTQDVSSQRRVHHLLISGVLSLTPKGVGQVNTEADILAFRHGVDKSVAKFDVAKS